MDIHPDVTMLPPEITVIGRERDAIVSQIRRRLAVEESTPADSRLLAAMDELLEETPLGYTVSRPIATPPRPALSHGRPPLKATRPSCQMPSAHIGRAKKHS